MTGYIGTHKPLIDWKAIKESNAFSLVCFAVVSAASGAIFTILMIA